MSEQFISELDSGREEFYQSTIRVTYSAPADTTRKVLMEFFDELTIVGDDTTHKTFFEFTRKNSDLSSVIAELKKNGLGIESYEGKDDHHYIMLVYPLK